MQKISWLLGPWLALSYFGAFCLTVNALMLVHCSGDSLFLEIYSCGDLEFVVDVIMIG